MTPAEKIRALIAACEREREGYTRHRSAGLVDRGNDILAAACRIRAIALRQCLKIVEEG